MNILSADACIALEYHILSLYICFRSNMSKISREPNPQVEREGMILTPRPGYRAFLYGLHSQHCSKERGLNPLKLSRRRPLLSFTRTYVRGTVAGLSRKEVFQPHLPVRLPCYDLAPITSFALGRSLR